MIWPPAVNVAKRSSGNVLAGLCLMSSTRPVPVRYVLPEMGKFDVASFYVSCGGVGSYRAGTMNLRVTQNGRLLRSSSATFQTTSIARQGNAAAAPLHRTFPIVIGETKGCFTAHSENIVRWLTSV
jgi:hypothetical protein